MPLDSVASATDALDEILLGVASFIEPSQEDRRIAETRYRRLKSHLERDGSPLAPYLVEGESLIYAQGSMATSTMIISGAALDRPYVIVRDPPISPRPGCRYEEIPHLMFDAESPERSGLCLFDPEGKEWTEADLIAETTIYWAVEWLLYYELWHMDGRWLGPSVGYESVAAIRAAEAELIRETAADVH